MDVYAIETRLGRVRLWGPLPSFSKDRPLLLLIRGAFPELDAMFGLERAFAQADVAFVHLPGMHSSFLTEHSVPAFASAFDQVLETLGHREVHVAGISIGGTVALGMRHPAIRSLLLIDAPLSTGALWPLWEPFRTLLADRPDVAPWMWNLFGISADEVVDRDYRPLLKTLATPAHVLLGGDPLGQPRPLQRMPSLVSSADRAAYDASAVVSVEVVPDTGHNIPRDGLRAIVAALRRAMADRPPVRPPSSS